MAGYTIFPYDALTWEPRPGGTGNRSFAQLSEGLTEMRANIFRLEPGARGVRHREGVQEELFVVLDGTLTLALGDPEELHELSRGSAAAVPPHTVIHVRNDSESVAEVLVVGAPPITGKAEHLPG
jgi:quercetin dioxygenase-like cupin family protein